MIRLLRGKPADGENPDTDDGVDYHHYLAEVTNLLRKNDLLQI